MARKPQRVIATLAMMSALALCAGSASAAVGNPFPGKFVGAPDDGTLGELKIRVVQKKHGRPKVWVRSFYDGCFTGLGRGTRLGPLAEDGTFRGSLSEGSTHGTWSADVSGEFISRKQATVQTDSTASPLPGAGTGCTEHNTFTVTRVKPPKPPTKKPK